MLILEEERLDAAELPGPCFGQARLRDCVRSGLEEWLGRG